MRKQADISSIGKGGSGAGGALCTTHEVIKIQFYINYTRLPLVMYLKSVDQ
jgi:hypothetical protein